MRAIYELAGLPGQIPHQIIIAVRIGPDNAVIWIEFDDQTLCRAIEVHDIWPYGMLTAKLHSRQPPVT